MLGSLAEADDAVQEAWIRLSRTDTSDVDNLRAWLTTVRESAGRGQAWPPRLFADARRQRGHWRRSGRRAAPGSRRAAYRPSGAGQSAQRSPTEPPRSSDTP